MVLLDIPTTYWPKAATVAYFHSYEPPDSDEIQVEVLRRFAREQKYAGFSVDGRFTNLLKAVRRRAPATPRRPPRPPRVLVTPPPPAVDAATASEAAFLLRAHAPDAAQAHADALEALRPELVSRDEFARCLVVAAKELRAAGSRTAAPFVARATALVRALERARLASVAAPPAIAAGGSNFVLTASTLGTFYHFQKCPRLLHRLAKRNADLDWRTRATSSSDGSKATRSFDRGVALLEGEPLTDSGLAESAVALSPSSLIRGRGADHERYINARLQNDGLAWERWFSRDAAADPSTFDLVDVEQLARDRARCRCAPPTQPGDRWQHVGPSCEGGAFEREYDHLSLELLKTAPVGTALWQPSLNAAFIADATGADVYEALGLAAARDRGDVRLARSLVDYVLVCRDARGRRALVVVDGKASPRVELAHQIQVSFYALVIETVCPGSCAVGGVWIAQAAAPSVFDVRSLMASLKDALVRDVAGRLTAAAHRRPFEADAEWCLRTSCAGCDFRTSCEKQAKDQGRLCSLPQLRADDADELRRLSADDDGDDELARLEAYARRRSAATPATTSSRRALARGLHLEYETDDAPPKLRAKESDEAVPTGRPSASLPYKHVEEAGVLVFSVDAHFRTRAPLAYVIKTVPRSQNDDAKQWSFVANFEAFQSDGLAGAAAAAAADVRRCLVDDVYAALEPFHGRRLCVCCAETSDKACLFDCLLQVALIDDDEAAAEKARTVMTALGAEPSHMLLETHHPSVGGGGDPREAKHFLPGLSVLVAEAKQLFAVPGVRETTFEDCCAYLPATVDGARDDLRAVAARCDREAVYQSWSLLSSDQLGDAHAAGVRSRVVALLGRRLDCALSVLHGMRARLRSLRTDASTTQQMDDDDRSQGRPFPLLPFKAASIHLRPPPGIAHAALSKLKFMTELEVATKVANVRQQRVRCVEDLVDADKIACVRLSSSDADDVGATKRWFSVSRGAAPRDIDALPNFQWLLAPLSRGGPALAVRFPDVEFGNKFGVFTSAPLVSCKVDALKAGDDGSALVRLEFPRNAQQPGDEEYALFSRHVDFVSAPLIEELERCAAKPEQSLFVSILDDAKVFCDREPEDCGLLADALRAVELDRPSSATASQEASFQRMLKHRGTVVHGPPGSGKTYFSATSLLRLCRAASGAGKQLYVVVTAVTHAAIDCLLEKASKLAGDDVRVVKIDHEAKRPSKPGDLCWLSPPEKARYSKKNAVAGEVVSVSEDGERYVVRVGGREVAASKNHVRLRWTFDVVGASTSAVDKLLAEGRPIIVGATTYKVSKILAADDARRCDVLLVDEASQMLQAQFALAARNLDPANGRLVVVGDHRQMAPTIRTQLPDGVDCGRSILDHLRAALRDTDCVGMLAENHRMCPALCDFTERALEYEGYRICSSGGCRCRAGAPAPERVAFAGAAAEILDDGEPLVVVELDVGGSASLADVRAAEARLCRELVREYDGALDRAGASRERGAFLVTPHHSQRHAVRDALGPSAKTSVIDTVERMQGREKDLVVACFAGFDLLGDDDGVELDFVYEASRAVVATTRAKRKLVVICTPRLFDPTLHVYNTERRCEAFRLLRNVREYVASRGRVVRRGLLGAAPPPADEATQLWQPRESLLEEEEEVESPPVLSQGSATVLVDSQGSATVLVESSQGSATVLVDDATSLCDEDGPFSQMHLEDDDDVTSLGEGGGDVPSQGSETVLVLEEDDDVTSLGGGGDDDDGVEPVEAAGYEDDDDDLLEADDVWVDSYAWRQPRAATPTVAKRIRPADDDDRAGWLPRRRLGFDAPRVPALARPRATRAPYRCRNCGQLKKGHLCAG